MNTGIVSSRYAKTLLMFSTERGDAERTCLQAGKIELSLRMVSELRRLVDDPAAVSDSEKLSLLESALGEEEMTGSLKAFLSLVIKKGRTPFLRLILHSFIDAYYKSRNILQATLITAVPAPKLESALGSLVKKETGKDVEIHSFVNPDIIGGFVFTLDDKRYDASVSRQLSTLRSEFTLKNRRIV